MSSDKKTFKITFAEPYRNHQIIEVNNRFYIIDIPFSSFEGAKKAVDTIIENRSKRYKKIDHAC